MAICMRGGLSSDFDPNKMLPREFAITTDTGEIYICTAPGEVVRLATLEQLNALLELSPEAYSALQELISLLGDQTVLGGLLSDVQNLKSGDVKYNFSEAELRNNIGTTDDLKGILGKIKKWFSDLKAVAFSGSYSDLIDVPTFGTAASKGVSNVLTQASDGYVLDARQGKALKDLISQLNSNLTVKTRTIEGAYLNMQVTSFGEIAWVRISGYPKIVMKQGQAYTIFQPSSETPRYGLYRRVSITSTSGFVFQMSADNGEVSITPFGADLSTTTGVNVSECYVMK